MTFAQTAVAYLIGSASGLAFLAFWFWLAS